jgi:ADP-L-glycero-D-manno-heptose 6-epimerase
LVKKRQPIILTGGAGFIGSCFLWRLNKEGIRDVIVVDNINDSGKWKNLSGKNYLDYIQKNEFLRLLENNDLPVPAQVIHMGACSSTLVTDSEYLLSNNYEYSKKLAHWAFNHKAPFLYASSAATYGDGLFGYDDCNTNTLRLKPLNMYGQSKQLFDLWVLNNGHEGKVTGLKFFNVFGPNEYHKGEMRSVICKNFPEIINGNPVRLFRSYNPNYKDGEQKRDFIYVKDAVEVMYYFFTHPDKTGIFNLGSGAARTWNDLAKAMFSSLGKPLQVEYIDMPETIREKYQYFTEAKMGKLKKTGFEYSPMPLEDSIHDYVGYLKKGAYL